MITQIALLHIKIGRVWMYRHKKRKLVCYCDIENQGQYHCDSEIYALES